MRKSTIVICVVIGVFVALTFDYMVWKGPLSAGQEVGVVSTFSTTTDSYRNQTTDIWGTHIGTSTVGVGFPSPNVTSSVVSKIGRNIKQATYQIKVISTTSTINNLSFTVQGSNDYLCDTSATAASSTTDVTINNINWYDAMSHLMGRVHPTTFGNASTTIVYDIANTNLNFANELTLVDLNYECLRFRISGSSTLPYVGLSTK